MLKLECCDNMPFFNNIKIELWSLTTSTDYDLYGNLKNNYTLTDTVVADLQPLTNRDQMEVFGKIIQDTYKVYLDKSIVISDTTILRVVGEEATYKIVGSPMDYNHLLPASHKKIIIEKQRTPTHLGG